jgi:hypothetical protein
MSSAWRLPQPKSNEMTAAPAVELWIFKAWAQALLGICRRTALSCWLALRYAIAPDDRSFPAPPGLPGSTTPMNRCLAIQLRLNGNPKQPLEPMPQKSKS